MVIDGEFSISEILYLDELWKKKLSDEELDRTIEKLAEYLRNTLEPEKIAK